MALIEDPRKRARPQAELDLDPVESFKDGVERGGHVVGVTLTPLDRAKQLGLLAITAAAFCGAIADDAWGTVASLATLLLMVVGVSWGFFAYKDYRYHQR